MYCEVCNAENQSWLLLVTALKLLACILSYFEGTGLLSYVPGTVLTLSLSRSLSGEYLSGV